MLGNNTQTPDLGSLTPSSWIIITTFWNVGL